MTADASQDSPFWRFSLAFYRNPAVAAACIDLQDRAGVDVNVLFFLLWNATLERTLPAEAVAELDRRIGAWRDAAVVPLREIRRALKSPPPVVEPGAAEAFRTRVKAMELEAERLQQHTLYGLAPSLRFEPAASALDAARANVAAYQANCPKAFPAEPVATILAAFASYCGAEAVIPDGERSEPIRDPGSPVAEKE
jgi:uncharacterized protein (TIGR02444 family)